MKSGFIHASHFLLQRYLLVAYSLFIIYVSLSPLSGWQDQGLSFNDVLIAPLSQTFTWFDFTLNCTSYTPLGLLLTYILHKHFSPLKTLLLATLCGLVLSLAMEYTQLYLPARVSSNTDLLSNTLGALIGSAFALHITQYNWFHQLGSWHHKFFRRGRVSDFGLTLIFLWIFAQTNPTLPMLGSVFVSEVARWPFDIVPATPFNWLESTEVSLNLFLLGILLFTLLRNNRHTLNALLLVLCIVTLIKFIAAAILLKSWALLLWLNSEAMFGIMAGLMMLAIVKHLQHRWLIACAAAASFSYLALVLDLLIESPPSAAMRIYHWHYVHMLNYNGFSQIIILIFPALLLSYLWRVAMQKRQ
jgi:VanZ family protein